MRDTIHIPNRGTTKIIAHRGVSGLETENTAAAYIAAGNRSYWGIETDIYRTSDGHYICNHDGSSGRICDVNLVMEQSTLKELRALRLKDIDGKSDRADLMLCIPSEYRKICESYGKVCVAELKSAFTPEEIAEIIDIFDGYLDRTCFISFKYQNLELIKKLRSEQHCQFLTNDWDKELPQKLSAAGMGLDISYTELSERKVRLCHEAGVEVNCWTVDTLKDAEKLIRWGVDQITTNILE